MTRNQAFEAEPLLAIDTETWENRGRGDTWVLKHDAKGHLGSQRLSGGQRVVLSSTERRLNEDQCATEDQNPFRNGTLSAVKLPDDLPEGAEFIANPNTLSDTAMKALYGKPLSEFTSKVAEITNPLALQRLRELATDEATVKQIAVVEAQEGVVSPKRTRKVRVAQDVENEVRAQEGTRRDVFSPQ